MNRVNQEGPAAVGDTPAVDSRHADAYAIGHIPGAITIPPGPAFLARAGCPLPYDRPIALRGVE